MVMMMEVEMQSETNKGINAMTIQPARSRILNRPKDGTIAPIVLERRAAARAFQIADDAWGDLLALRFGDKARDARYDKRGKGSPGDALRSLHDARMNAMEAWEKLVALPDVDHLVTLG